MPKSPTPTHRAPSAEVEAPKPARRYFSPADKLRIVREVESATEPGQIEAIIRREGIYSSYLTSWRKEIEQHGVEGLKKKRPVHRNHDTPITDLHGST